MYGPKGSQLKFWTQKNWKTSIFPQKPGKALAAKAKKTLNFGNLINELIMQISNTSIMTIKRFTPDLTKLTNQLEKFNLLTWLVNKTSFQSSKFFGLSCKNVFLVFSHNSAKIKSFQIYSRFWIFLNLKRHIFSASRCY